MSGEPGHADLPHPALGQDFTPSPTARRAHAVVLAIVSRERRNAQNEQRKHCSSHCGPPNVQEPLLIILPRGAVPTESRSINSESDIDPSWLSFVVFLLDSGVAWRAFGPQDMCSPWHRPYVPGPSGLFSYWMCCDDICSR